MANPPPLKADENGFVSATDFEEWLVSWEVYAAKLMGDAAAKIAEKHLNMYVDTLVASGDASVFDPMTAEWQVAVDEFLDLGVKPMYLQGSIGAQLGAPMMPIDLLAEWTEVVNVNAKNYVATASNRIVGASQSIWSQVQFSAEQSISVGVEIPKLRQEVENITGYARGRAQAIARTETMGAYNGGDMDGARALGEYGPVEKSWLATPGSRTRASHKKANNQTVLMDESFIVGGKSMDRPLDPSGPADEVVNCRCVMQMFFVGDTRPDGTTIEAVTEEVLEAPVAREAITQETFTQPVAQPFVPDGPTPAERRPKLMEAILDRTENGDDWRRSSDLEVRGTAVWQQEYDSMRAVRQAEMNLRAGRPALDGVEVPNLKKLRYARTDDDVFEVLSSNQMRDEIEASARVLRKALDEATPTSPTMYRGMTVGDDFKLSQGQKIDLDVTSFTDDVREALSYTESDYYGDRVGSRAVIIEVLPGSRSVSLSGSATGKMAGSSERVYQGGLVIESVEQRGEVLYAIAKAV